MNHLILSRFYCQNLGLNIFDEGILEQGYNNMVRWFIPSLNNQTNKDFILIILKTKLANIYGVNGKLYDLQKICKFPVEVVNFEDLNTYLNKFETDKLILSRCDIDDSIRMDMVDIIQNKLEDFESGLIGFNLGFEQDIKNPYKLKLFSRNYADKLSSFSVMQTIKINSNKNNIHPYMWNHSSPSKFFSENKIEFDLVDINNNDRMFIRNITQINGSLEKTKIIFNSSQVSNMSKETIQVLFGV